MSVSLSMTLLHPTQRVNFSAHLLSQSLNSELGIALKRHPLIAVLSE